jgi:ABC-2 type transport system ATP-binding protein
MLPLAIDIEKVSKRYANGVLALHNATLTVRQGEIFGLLGANGAGKSTLVKILTTLVNPTEFQGRVLGKSLGSMASKRRMGYLPEQVRFAEHLTAKEFLVLAGRLQGMGRATVAAEAKRLLGVVGLAEWENSPMQDFSKGMRQRLGLAQAIVHNPDLILLDEPTDGVDPIGRSQIRSLIFELKQQGKTVLINSHLLSELETVCDRVAILQQGQVVRQGSIADLTRGGNKYILCVEGDLLDNKHLTELVEALGGSISLPVGTTTTSIIIPTSRPQVVQPVLDELRRGGHIITSLTPQKQSLEEFFLHTVGVASVKPPASKPPAVPPTDNHATMH